MYITVID